MFLLDFKHHCFTLSQICHSFFLRTEISTQVFSYDIFKNSFFHRTPPVAASKIENLFFLVTVFLLTFHSIYCTIL